MGRILAIGLVLIVFPNFSWAQTSYSRLLERVQATYLSSSSYPILIMDRDDLEWRFARAGAVGERETPTRIAIVRAYVEEKTRVKISENAAANFEPYLTILKDAAVAMPALKDGSYSEFEMCAIFPPDPNRNQRLEHERVLQLGVAEAYGKNSFHGLREKLSYQDAILFSILHESGHCLDRFYFSQLLERGGDAASVHQSESFAETVAAFLMAKEGRMNVSMPRAYLRDLYSYFMEPYFANHPEFGLGNENFPYGGLIYHLSPSLREAGALISSQGERIRAMPLEDILELAHGVVEKNAIQSRLLTALYSGYSEGRAVALDRYRGFEERMPDLFAGFSQAMEAYWKAEDAFRAKAFLEEAGEEPVTEDLLPFDFSQACEHFRNGDMESVLKQVESLRLNLQKSFSSHESQMQRFSFLSGLWGDLPLRCQGKLKAPQLSSKKKASMPVMDFIIHGMKKDR